MQLEIKVAESWTLKQLEDALLVQLIGQYLRDRHNNYGILLLVYQERRDIGWKNAEGTFWQFEQVTELLRSIAHSIAVESPGAPQAEIAVIDVTSAATVS